MGQTPQPIKKDLATRLSDAERTAGIKGVISTIIGGTMFYVGYTFDQGMTDEIVKWGGALLIGISVQDAVNYIKYKFSKKNPEDYQE